MVLKSFHQYFLSLLTVDSPLVSRLYAREAYCIAPTCSMPFCAESYYMNFFNLLVINVVLGFIRSPVLNLTSFSILFSSFRTELWRLQLSGTALSINCDPVGNVILTLMDGTVAFLTVKCPCCNIIYVI